MTSTNEKRDGGEVRPGDRVKITCEGVVKSVAPDWRLIVELDDNRNGLTVFSGTEMAAPTFSMKVLPRPLEVGSRVANADGSLTGKIDYLRGEWAVVWWGSSPIPELILQADLHPLTEEASQAKASPDPQQCEGEG